VQEIGDWLEKLGMSEYAERFAENDIDTSVLPHLTDENLKELGISLGHRVKLLAAIRELGGTLTTVEPTVTPTEPKPQGAAERRQVTVMFSDLVGSTALSARMDPEDLREVISDYQKCVAETVQRFGGFVAKYMGDGVLVYFGYPQASEDDAERAVRAGLELVTAVTSLKTSAPLQARISIATGLAVVGDLIESEVHEQGVVGEIPNLAARLQGIAEPNRVVIADRTRGLLGNLFELEDLGARDIKGIAKSVRAWAVLRPSSVESRFEALHARDLTDLVGREEELELLLRRWSKAKTGKGQVVLLCGEAGIGKSRLTAVLLERIATDPHTRLRYFCSPHYTDSAFYPIVRQITRAAGHTYNDNLQTKLDKLDALLAQTSTSIQDIALFAEMLSLPNDGRYPELNLTSQQRRQRTLGALTAQMQVLTRQNSVLIILEDAHWTDPTSLEAFGLVMDQIRTHRVLLLVTFRPEFQAPWIGRPYVTALTLNRLGKREVSALIDRVVGNKLILANVRQDIIERTDGIPLFVEEMTKAVLEVESDGEALKTAAAEPGATHAVPASLHASLLARLDRLGPAKEVAQIAAAIGREFPHSLLAAVARKSEDELAFALNSLNRAGLVLREGVLPHASYIFKHALVQDAAYGMLLRQPRRALHARIAKILETSFADIAESQPELLARHCSEAGLIEKAALLWGKAGQRSLARSALVEAAAQLTRALDQIARLPATPALRREQIKFQVGLANALMHTKGYAAPETKVAIEQARLFIERSEALGEPLEDPLLLFSAIYGLWAVNFVAFKGDICRDLAARFWALAQRQGAATPVLIGHRVMGHSLLKEGDFVQARTHYDKGIALYDPVEHRMLATRFGHDTGVAILSYRSWTLWFLGYPEAALRDADTAVEAARDTGQAASLMFALYMTAFFHVLCGNYAVATARARELFALAKEKDALMWKASGMMHEGCALAAAATKAAAAIEMLTSGIVGYRSTGATLSITAFLSHLARAYGDNCQFDDAWRCIGEAVTVIENAKERWYEAEVHRTAGEIALLSPERDVANAEAYFERALAVARQQQAKSWELRAVMSMARLWRDQGKRDEARELLAPVYNWFTEGFNTLDLKEAKALLNELVA
jgi:class 3 adenylate cyclase/predicted ATPase